MLGTVTEGSTQHPPLHRIGVLKLIHHHRPVALLERQQPGGLLLAWIQGRQQAREGDHPTATPALGQFSQTFLEKVRPDPFDRAVPELGDGPLQGRAHQAGIRLTAFARDAGPTTGMEIVQQLFDRDNRFQRRQRVLLIDPLLHLCAAIRAWLNGVGRGGFDALCFPLLRGGAEPRLQSGVIPVPKRQEVGPCRLDPTLQLRCERLIELNVIVRVVKPRPNVVIQLRQTTSKTVGRQSALTETTELRQR